MSSSCQLLLSWEKALVLSMCFSENLKMRHDISGLFANTVL